MRAIDQSVFWRLPGHSTPQRRTRPVIHHKGWTIRTGSRARNRSGSRLPTTKGGLFAPDGELFSIDSPFCGTLTSFILGEPLVITIVAIKFPVNTSDSPGFLRLFFPYLFPARGAFDGTGFPASPTPRRLGPQALAAPRRRNPYPKRTGHGQALRNYAGSSRSPSQGGPGGAMCCGTIPPERRATA